MTVPAVPPRRPRVLFVSALQIYPTTSGGTLRSFGLASGLRRQGLDVRVHSLTGRKRDYLARRASSVQVWPCGTEEHVERGVLSALDWLGGYVLAPPPVWIGARLFAGARSPGQRLLPRALRRSLAWCDALVADFPFCAPVFAAPALGRKPRVLSTHNVEHHLLGGSVPGAHWRPRPMGAAVRWLETRAAAASDLVVACCDEDARFFEQHARAPRTLVVPNGVDVGRFAGLHARRAPARQALGIANEEKVLLFTGSRWGPNAEAFAWLLAFAREHAALLREERLHLLVVGNVAPEPLRRPGLTAVGRVDEVEPYFAAADAGLNPLLAGAGTNVKTGEFIAARLPVVTTAFGARGFDLADGASAFVFERGTLAPVLRRVSRLFDRDRRGLRAMAEAAWARNERVVDMDACVRPLAQALRGLRPGASRP
jgi:glycosyltransferase involved in cell wall biosynthesis